jgi:hypothetical protein
MNDILIIALAALGKAYEQGKIMAISGKDGTKDWDPGDINDPVDTGYQLEPTAGDPLLNPMVHRGDLQILLSKIVSPPTGQPAGHTTYTVLQPSNMDMHDWSKPRAENVTLEYPTGTLVATNPHGLAQVGRFAYIGSNDSHLIFTLKAGELDGKKNVSHTLQTAPFDVAPFLPSGTLDNAKGQSVIALQNKAGAVFLFVLFVVYDPLEEVWRLSVIVRLAVNATDGSLSYSAYTTVGKNAQEMWPIFKGENDTDVLLLISAVGGVQQAGITNGTQSNVCALPAFGVWPTPPAPSPEPPDVPAAVRLFTGDPPENLYPREYGAPKAAKDLRVAAASTRPSPNARAFFMAAGFTIDYRGADYRIYRTIAQKLFDLYNSQAPSDTTDPEEPEGSAVPRDDPPTPQDPPTVSELVEDGIFEVVREGQVYSSADVQLPYGVFYLGLLYENADDPAGERILQFLGSALTIDSAENFGGRSLTFGLGEGPGHIGGENVNSAVQLAETIRQYEKGHSMKRGVKAVRVPLMTVLVSGEEEEREDE